jgi:hypothetical protein
MLVMIATMAIKMGSMVVEQRKHQLIQKPLARM